MQKSKDKEIADLRLKNREDRSNAKIELEDLQAKYASVRDF